MVEARTTTTRPDADIQEDIRDMIAHYPPLNMDRHHLKVEVDAGHLTITGHVKAPSTHRYMLEMLPTVEGVMDVNASAFFNDEAIRLELGHVVPPGVLVNVEYGAVILSGHLPAGVDEAELIQRVKAAAGVRQIVTAFRK